ncbi:uncharacterized protein [Palaemon carinicauda]|uniref:uncharacterized protein n=1 Tax=Palaemon carinicauda TaxID=392227 RepID=UPI0035B5A450
MSIIVCYAQTNGSAEDMEDEYYEELPKVIDKNPERDIKIKIGDFNAKFGRNNQGIENVMGFEGLDEDAIESGEHFMSFGSANIIVIGGTLFQHKNIHKLDVTNTRSKQSSHSNSLCYCRECSPTGLLIKVRETESQPPKRVNKLSYPATASLHVTTGSKAPAADNGEDVSRWNLSWVHLECQDSNVRAGDRRREHTGNISHRRWQKCTC